MIQMLKLALRNLGRNRRRSIFSALAMGMALALLLLMASVIQGEYGDAIELAIRLQSGHLQVRAATYDEAKTSLQWERFDREPRSDRGPGRLDRTGGRGDAPAVCQRLRDHPQRSAPVRVVGIDPPSGANAPYRDGILEGAFLVPDDREGILIGWSLAHRLGLSAGDQVSLSVNTSSGEVDEQEFTIRGIYSTGTSGFDGVTVLLPLAKTQAFTGAENHASSIFVLLKDTSQTDAVIAAIDAPGYEVLTWRDMNDLLVQTENLASGYMSFFYLIVLGIAATVIVNTLVMSVFERTREIGILSAIGMRGRRSRWPSSWPNPACWRSAGSCSGCVIGGSVIAYFTRYGLPMRSRISASPGCFCASGSTPS